MKKSIIAIALGLGLLNLSCSGNEKKAIQKMPTIKVSVVKAKAVSQAQKIQASGTIEAENSANISTRMMGYVRGLHVKVGQKVSKGQRLVSVNSTDLQAKKAQVDAQIQKAEAGYANAEKDYQRFVALFKNQSASQKELDDMTTRYEMAKSGLETAKQMGNEINAQFAYSELKAPFSGVVTNTFVKVGDMANPGMPIVTIEGAKNYQVMAMVSEKDIVTIQNNMSATVVVKSSQEEIKGTVIEVSQSAKNTGGQYLVKLVLAPTKSKILPGMFVNVAFEVPASEKELLENSKVFINTKHLVTKGQLKGVYAVGTDNVTLLRWLRLGSVQNGAVEVLSGLSEGEQYIIRSEGKLYNGAPIQIQK